MPYSMKTMDQPYDTLLLHFWKCLLRDLTEQGVTLDDLPEEYSSLKYSERVTIERKELSVAAKDFLRSDQFKNWAALSNLNPDELREKLCQSLKP